MSSHALIWTAGLEIAALFLAMPHLAGLSGASKVFHALTPAAAYLGRIAGSDLRTAPASRWLEILVFVLACVWLPLAAELKVNWYGIAPAVVVVVTPAVVLLARALARLDDERRLACLIAGGLLFLLAKSIVIGSALSRA